VTARPSPPNGQSVGGALLTPPWRGLVLRDAARDLRRSLRPVVWVVLEEIALDAVAVDGGLVARTSARLIAQHLGLDPGTAASALRTLRVRGLVELAREPGPSGRFGLSVYRLSPLPGVEELAPCMDSPCVESPPMAGADIVGPAVPARRLSRRRSPPATSSGAQGALDLGLEDR
jgi:hypothetical protein